MAQLNQLRKLSLELFHRRGSQPQWMIETFRRATLFSASHWAFIEIILRISYNIEVFVRSFRFFFPISYASAKPIPSSCFDTDEDWMNESSTSKYLVLVPLHKLQLIKFNSQSMVVVSKHIKSNQSSPVGHLRHPNECINCRNCEENHKFHATIENLFSLNFY